MALLSDGEIQERLANLHGWVRAGAITVKNISEVGSFDEATG